MKWKTLLASSALLVLICVSSKDILYACSEYYASEYSRIFFFLPENSNNTGDKWWLKQTNTFSDNVPLDTNLTHSVSDYDLLLEEWRTVLGLKFSKEDVETAIFNSKLSAENQLVLDSLDLNNPKAALILEELKAKPAWQDYLLIAKELEYLTIGYSYEDYEKTENELAQEAQKYDNIRETILKHISQTENKVLKAKYYFQLVKISAASLNPNQTKIYLDQLLELEQSKTLEGWAKLYYAEIAEKTSSLNVLLAEVIQACPSKTKRCLDLFRPFQDTQYIEEMEDSMLASILWSVHALHDFRPNADYIEKIIALDPNNFLLIDLVNREINKYEDRMYSKSLTGFEVFDDGKTELDAEYQKLHHLFYLPNVAKIKNKFSQEFFVLAQAHLEIVNGDTKNAIQLLKGFSSSFRSHQIQAQISLLLAYSSVKTYSEETKNALAQTIKQIVKLNSPQDNENVNRCISGVLLKIKNQYEANGNQAMAGLCFLRSNMGMFVDTYFSDTRWLELNATHADFLAIEKLLNNSSNSEFEALLVMGLSKTQVYNSHARVYLREQNFSKAIEYFELIPDWTLCVLYNFTFNSNQLFGQEAKNPQLLSVTEALRAINAKIQNVAKIQDQNQKAKEYFAIGNALFGISNQGQYSYLTADYSSNYAPASPKEIKAKYPTNFFDFYFKAKPAFYYFEKAEQCSTDLELSAKISFVKLRAFDEVYDSMYDYSTIPKTDWINYERKYRNTNYYMEGHMCPNVEEFM